MPKKSSAKHENGRYFTQSPKARAIVEEVKKANENISDFISECIEEYGPIVLAEKTDKDKKIPPLAARLKYLEETVVAWAYYDIAEGEDRWDAATIKAHQDVLKSTGKKTWYNAKSIEAIMNIAAENPKTKDTEVNQWQTLLRNHKKFSTLKSK